MCSAVWQRLWKLVKEEVMGSWTRGARLTLHEDWETERELGRNKPCTRI